MREEDIVNDCLVIIDVQKGFLTKDTDYIPDRVRKLLESRHFDHIVSTRFMNSKDSPHYIFTNWEKMMDSESQKLNDYIASVSEKIFDKSVNSCFSEEFLLYLEEKDIGKLYFLGIDTDCCVMKSAFDCFDRKIPFEVIIDCCASTGGEKVHEAACEIMRRNFGDAIMK